VSVTVRRYGAQAALVEVSDASQAAALAAWARADGVPAAEIVPAARTVLFDGVEPDWLVGRLASWKPEVAPPPGPVVEVPVVFDGPDLDFVAARCGGDPAGLLASVELTSAFCGFAPGFAYLIGLPDALRMPRLASPRARVEPGSVGLADGYCGVYPTASPGGWRIVGHTDAVLWDASRAQPALLAPGTRVVLRPC
jgi:KipI family sensor histidine kinase inhibitor